MKNHRQTLWTALAVLVAFPSLPAQTTAPAAGPEARKPDDEIIRLSPFEVRAEENRGYVASETMTGTRVATQIIDLPYTVNVVTSEFFEDFGLFQLDDTLTQVGGMTGLDIGGGFNLRGFSSSSQLRDGFYRLGRYGQTNIDRLEIIKGPNAGIYGRTSPGGMVNMISKAPRKENAYRLTLRGGSFDTAQATVQSTGIIGSPDTYHIFIGSQYNRGGADTIDWFHVREDQGFLALKHDFDDGAHLLVSAEYFKQYRNAPQSSAPLITDQKNTATNTDDEAIGYAMNLARYNAFGPHSELYRGSNTGYLSYDKQLNDTISIRAGGQLFQANRWDYNQNTGFGAITINSTTAASNLTSTRGATPNRGLIFETGGGLQFDTVARYDLFNGKVGNKTLVTVDVNDYYRYDPTRNSNATAALAAWGAAGSGRIVALSPDYRPLAPLTYFGASLEEGGQAALTRYTRRRATVFGGMFRQESRWLEDRLLTYFGARFDKVKFSELEYLGLVNGVRGTVTDPVVVKRTVNQAKPNFGALYKVNDGFRVYANYSESYFVNQTDNPADIASPLYKPETAEGWDYGIKGALLDNRLNYTLGFYDIQRFNVRVTDVVESPEGSGNFVTITRPDGDQKDTGWEADVNWAVDRNWSTGLSFGHVKAIYSDFGTAFPLSVGRKVQNVSPENGSVYLKFSGSEGRLKGFSANLGVTYVAETPSEGPNAGDTYTTGAGGVRTLVRSTGQWRLTIPSFTLWNLGLNYEWKQGPAISHKLQLNVNNLLDRDYLKVNKTLGDPRGIFFSYTLGFSRD